MLTGAWVPLTTEYGIPIFEPWYSPDPKSACIPTVGPMKLMMAAEFGSTGEAEISWFQRLSLAKGRKPFRLAPCPVLIAPQALWVLLPEPDPPEPLLPPEPLPPEPLPPEPLPVPLPPADSVELLAAPPPQFAQASANTSAPVADSILVQENFMPLLSQETTGKPRDVRSWSRRKSGHVLPASGKVTARPGEILFQLMGSRFLTLRRDRVAEAFRGIP